MQKKLDQTTRKALNLFFILFLTIGALLAGSVALLYRAELNTFFSEMMEIERQALGRQSSVIGDEFDAIVSDLLFLSRQNELRAYLQRKDTQTRFAIQAEYMEMSTAKKIYDQIRYLDENGMEKVRVNFAAGKPEAVSP